MHRAGLRWRCPCATWTATPCARRPRPRIPTGHRVPVRAGTRPKQQVGRRKEVQAEQSCTEDYRNRGLAFSHAQRCLACRRPECFSRCGSGTMRRRSFVSRGPTAASRLQECRHLQTSRPGRSSFQYPGQSVFVPRGAAVGPPNQHSCALPGHTSRSSASPDAKDCSAMTGGTATSDESSVTMPRNHAWDAVVQRNRRRRCPTATRVSQPKGTGPDGCNTQPTRPDINPYCTSVPPSVRQRSRP